MVAHPVRVPPALQLVRIKGQVLVPLPTVLLSLVLALLLYAGVSRSGEPSIVPQPQQQQQQQQHAFQHCSSWLNRANDSWPVSR